MKNGIIKLLVFLGSILSIPLVMMLFGLLDDGELLASWGLRTNPNYSGGILLAEFTDPAEDLLEFLPEEYATNKNALDLRSFSVAKLAFSPWAGQGIAARVNLIFEFDGKLPDPYDSFHGFCLTVLHAYLDSPFLQSKPRASERSVEGSFSGAGGWDFLVIIDGFHEQARIFDTQGKLVGQSLDIILQELPEEAPQDAASGALAEADALSGSTPELRIAKTRIVIAVPISLVGDPTKGKWNYYAAVGLSDPRSPSGMNKRPFDIIECRGGSVGSLMRPLPGERR